MQRTRGLRTVELLGDLVTRLHHQPRRKLTLLVGIDGPRRAGKTSFSTALAAFDPAMTVVTLDDFASPPPEDEPEGNRTEGRRPPETDRSDVPSVGFPEPEAAELDWRRLRNQLLLPLQGNRPSRYERYDAASGTRRGWREVGVGGIVIVEGVYACMRPLVAAYDFRIFVTAPRDVLLRRRHERGDASSEHRTEGADPPAEAAYMADQDPAGSAHLVVDGAGEVACDREREYVRVRT